jgi:hypothetical protein
LETHIGGTIKQHVADHGNLVVALKGMTAVMVAVAVVVVVKGRGEVSRNYQVETLPC